MKTQWAVRVSATPMTVLVEAETEDDALVQAREYLHKAVPGSTWGIHEASPLWPIPKKHANPYVKEQ